MASIKKNIVANFIGKIWSGAVIILLIPLYIKYLGIESYGLVGFYSTLITTLTVLDFGLSTTLTRELAKYSSGNTDWKNIRDLAFSLENIYWAIGLLICFFVILLSGFISIHWLKVETLPLSIVRQSVMLMGAVIAFQWPISLYSGGLTGLEKQVLNNSIMIVMTTVRAAGVIIILKYFSATIQAFFIWQAVTSLLYVLTLRWGFWSKMDYHPLPAKFSKDQIKTIWRFAAGMTGISFITFFLAQIDKILLSKILPLSQFGYYTLAFTIATSVTLIVVPLSLSFFPRFTNLIANGKQQELISLYHKACKLMATLVSSICFVLLFFTKEIIMIWTNNSTTTQNTYIIAQVLIAGSILNSLMVLPYNLLLANGRTRFTIYQNIIASVILVPLLFWWTNIYGALGAAFVWVIVNAGYVLVSQPLMHRILLKNELKKWYLNDTLMPMIPPFLTIMLIKISLRYIFPGLQVNLVLITVISIITFAVSILNMGSARILLRSYFKIKI